MIKQSMLAVLIFGLLIGLTASDKYAADTPHTNIGFSVKHMVITNVKGKFKDFEVIFNYDENDISKSSVTATIKAASIDTDNEKRDNHLRSGDFLMVEKYPEITFVSKDIRKKGDDYVANGTLTIRGVTKEIQLPFEILGKIKDPYGNTRLGLEASTTINRHDFGVSWNKTLDTGGLVVGDEVGLNFDVEFIKQ